MVQVKHPIVTNYPSIHQETESCVREYCPRWLIIFMRLPKRILPTTTKLEPNLHPSIACPEPSPVQANLLKGFAGKVSEEASETITRKPAADDWQHH